MKSKFLKMLLATLILAMSLGPLTAGAAERDHSHAHSQCLTPAMVKLKGDLRRLWIDHVVWTRSYIVSALAGLEDQEKLLARLLKNQQDIANAFRPYYGDAAATKLAELLTQHIALAGQVLTAAKSGNENEFAKANKDWYRNADDIAKFLSKANPNWTNQQLRDLLHTHLRLLWDLMAARLKKDWDGDIAAYDKGEDHIITLADALTEGVIKQFPEKFN